ncbi:MAG: HAD family hydrolase [Pseudomonadota bacterium]
MLDVDGVLVDGRPNDGKHWTTDLSGDVGISPAELSKAFFETEWTDVVEGRKGLLPTLTAILTGIGSSVGAEELIAYWFEKDSRVIGRVFADCKSAKDAGIPVYLATNQEHNRASFFMETMGLGTAVDGIVYSAQIGWQKTHPEFYSNAQRVTGFESADLLLVDNTPGNIEGAIEAGWSAVLWDENESLSDILHRSIQH